MLNFIQANIEAGCVPVSATGNKTLFGVEVFYRFRRYHNSRSECIKMGYVAAAEWAAIDSLMKTRNPKRHGIARNQKGSGGARR